MPEISLDSYWFSFKPTKNGPINRVLGAVARAGRCYHNTADWREPISSDQGALSAVELIQSAANEAEAQIARERHIAMRTAVFWAAGLCRLNVMATPYGRLRDTGKTYNGYVIIPDDVPDANHQGRGYAALLREKAEKMGPDIGNPTSDKGQEKFDALVKHLHTLVARTSDLGDDYRLMTKMYLTDAIFYAESLK